MGGLIAADKKTAFLKLDETLRECQREITEADASGNQMLKSLAVAEATQALRDLLTEKMMASVMRLMNSPLGFKTDRDGSQRPCYTAAEVKDPLIVGLLRGFRPVGNEMNIIAGNFYATKEGMERAVREFPGLTDLRMKPGVPKMLDGGALVSYTATWRLDGVLNRIDCQAPKVEGEADTRLAIRVNKSMGIDAILGKAKAKMLKRIYEQLTGSAQSLADEAHDEETIVGAVIEHQDSTDEQADFDPAAEIINLAIEKINASSDPERINKHADTAIDELNAGGFTGIDVVNEHRTRRLAEIGGAK